MDTKITIQAGAQMEFFRGSDQADVLRRTSWDIYMAGAYQTAGESARRGTNVWPDTGGGWVNGRGDDTQTMLVGYRHIVEFLHQLRVVEDKSS